MRIEVAGRSPLEALASAGAKEHSVAALDNRTALQICARSDSDSLTQSDIVASPTFAQEPQPDTSALTCIPNMHLPAASEGSSSAQALPHRVITGTDSEQPLTAAAVPAEVRRLVSEENEEGGYLSSPSSTESTLMLKPLTPAQSGEHRLHDLEARMQDAVKSGAGPHPAPLLSAEADNMSCEVCGISATSPDLLEQHLQGRKHQRRLAEEADAAGIRQSVEYPCDVCNVVTSSEEQLAVHMDGKRHRKHILMAEVTNSPVADAGADDEELHCELCDVTAPSSTHKQIHLRGQKHQRREKQEQHLIDAQQACNSTLDVLLDESGTDDITGHLPQQSEASAPRTEQRQQCEQVLVESAAGDCASEDAGEGGVTADKAASGIAEADIKDTGGIIVSRGRAAAGVSGEEEVEFQGCGVPSAFADPSSFGGGTNDTASEGGSGGDAPGDCLSELPRRTLTLRPSGMRVRFSQSFDEDALSDSEDSMRRLSSKPPLAPSGGSVSLAAQHFCPVCGIIATSQANLEDHVRGRRHARRLQYIGNMPESERTPFMQRVASGDWHLLRRKDSTGSTGSNSDAMALLRIGSITLPSSMDLRQYLEQMQEVGDGSDPEPEDGVSAAASDAAPNGGSAAAVTAAMHPEADAVVQAAGEAAGGDTEACREGLEDVSDAGDSEDTELAMADGSIDSGAGPKERHECIVCGITTTSAAHLEAHLRGRKHKRRVEVSGGRLQRPSSHYCKICDITTTSAQHMAMHVAGKAHLRRLTTGHLPAAAALAVAASGAGTPAMPQADSSAGAPLQPRPAISVSTRQPSPAPCTAGEAAAAAAATAAAATSAAFRKIDQDDRSASVRSVDGPQLPKSRHVPQQLPQQAQWAQHQQQQMPSMQPGAVLHTSPSYNVQYVGYYPQQQAFYPAPVAGHQRTLPGYLPPAAWGQWLPSSGAFPPAAPAHGAGYHQLPAMYAVPQLSPRYGYQAAFPPQQQAPGSFPGGHFAKGGGSSYAAGARPIPAPQQNGADYNCEVCGTNAPDLETYKQHIRTKPHVRRLNNNRPGGP